MGSGIREHWQRLELLHDGGEVRRLQAAMSQPGCGITRHYNAETDAFALVLWEWGVGDYARLLSRDDFLRSNPGEAGLVEYLTWRNKRVEFGGVTLDRTSRELAEKSRHAFLALVLEGLSALRERCVLGNGFLVMLDEQWLDRVHELSLFDRRVELLGRAGGPPRPVADSELSKFDRELEELRHGA